MCVSWLRQLASQVHQLASHVCQLVSHVRQLASHALQLESHVRQLMSHVCQLASHVRQFVLHVRQLASHVWILEASGPRKWLLVALGDMGCIASGQGRRGEGRLSAGLHFPLPCF